MVVLLDYRDTAVDVRCVYSGAPVFMGNTFQVLPRLRETADNIERYV
jgi:hypothetical protein